MVQVRSQEDYTAVVEQFSNLVYRIAYQNLMNVADAEDVVQDVFLRLLKHRDKSFADSEHLKAWLIRVTVNRCRDYSRFALRRRETELNEELAANEEEQNPLLEEIAKLKRDERTVLYLHYYEGYSTREIAEILGKSVNTVGSRLTRAREKLKMELKEAGYEYLQA